VYTQLPAKEVSNFIALYRQIGMRTAKAKKPLATVHTPIII